jgi:hypothetical protein
MSRNPTSQMRRFMGWCVLSCDRLLCHYTQRNSMATPERNTSTAEPEPRLIPVWRSVCGYNNTLYLGKMADFCGPSIVIQKGWML